MVGNLTRSSFARGGLRRSLKLPRPVPSRRSRARTPPAAVGPSMAYGIAGYAAAGERRMIVGRNADGTWFQTIEGCYINSRLLKVELVQGTPFPQGADVGDLMSLIPEVPDPPTPTVPTIVCMASMGQGDCAAAGGTWGCATKCGLACTEFCTCGCP